MLKHCNRCGFETLRNNKEEENDCPYHQEVMHDEGKQKDFFQVERRQD